MYFLSEQAKKPAISTPVLTSELLKVTQKVSFLYLLGKHYWGHSQHILSIFKSYTFESDTFESDTFESDTFFDIFAKCMESVWDDPNSDFLEDLKNFKSDTLKVTLFVSLLEVHSLCMF